MKYFFVAFSSRSQAMRLFESLKRACITASLINTPKAASLGCGLSVKFGPCDFVRVSETVKCDGYTAVHGFFEYSCGAVHRL